MDGRVNRGNKAAFSYFSRVVGIVFHFPDSTNCCVSCYVQICGALRLVRLGSAAENCRKDTPIEIADFVVMIYEYNFCLRHHENV